MDNWTVICIDKEFDCVPLSTAKFGSLNIFYFNDKTINQENAQILKITFHSSHTANHTLLEASNYQLVLYSFVALFRFQVGKQKIYAIRICFSKGQTSPQNVSGNSIKMQNNQVHHRHLTPDSCLISKALESTEQ